MKYCLSAVLVLFLFFTKSYSQETNVQSVKPKIDFEPLLGKESVVSRRPSPFANSRMAAVANEPGSFVITYNDEFPEETKAAFEYAIELFDQELYLLVDINIVVNQAPATNPNALASAGPWTYYTSTDTSNRWYPVGLWNQLRNTDQEPSNPDIQVTINSDFTDWYYATDGQVPSNQIDFVSVVMHEFCHGLGFLGSNSYTEETDSYSLGYDLSGETRPTVYDELIFSGDSTALTDFIGLSADLFTQLTSDDLHMHSSRVAEDFEGRPKVYAPTEYSQGSTLGHLDESTYTQGDANSLMSPIINYGESNHDIGPVVRAYFDAIGYTLQNNVLTASFTSNLTSIGVGSSVSFTSTGTGEATSYQWIFEGGNPDTTDAEQPVVLYNSPGTYDVTLIVGDRTTFDTLTIADYITVSETDLETGLISYFPLDGDFSDTTSNNIIEATGSIGFYSDRFNKSPKAVYIAQTNYLEIPNSTTLESITNEVGFSFWFRTSKTSGNLPFINRADSGSVDPGQFGIWYNSDTDSLYLELVTNAVIKYTFNTNEWYHLGVSIDAESYQVYINGELAADGALDEAMASSTSPIIIGQKWFGTNLHKFYGYLDDLFFYNRPLTSAEIAEQYIIGTEVFANFNVSSTEIIEGNKISFNSNSTGPDVKVNWIFEGADTETSSNNYVDVFYSTPGVFDVTMIAYNEYHSDTLYHEDYITVSEETRQITFVEDFDASSGMLITDANGDINYAGDVNNDGLMDFFVRNYLIFGASSNPDTLTLADESYANQLTFSGGNFYENAGDVNGDGITDIIGINGSEVNVIFGSADLGSTFDLTTIDGTNGFVIALDAVTGFTPSKASGVGDVNNDGFDDVIMSAPASNAAGIVFIIYGSASPTARFQLDAIDGSNGFYINGLTTTSSAKYGYDVDDVGDVNGDGIDDFAVVSLSGTFVGLFNDSYTTVIYGRDGNFPEELLLTDLDGTNGYIMNKSTGAWIYDVGSIGDINNDGFDDIAVKESYNYAAPGYIYLIYGTGDEVGKVLDLDSTAILNRGVTVIVNNNDYQLRPTMSGGFDSNQDGINDFTLSIVDLAGDPVNDGVYTIYGKTDFADTINLGSFQEDDGFIIKSKTISDLTLSGTTLGDINGDDLEDYIMSGFTTGFVYTGGSPNSAPIVVNEIENQDLDLFFNELIIDISEVFSDPDEDELTITASASSSDVITVAIDGTNLVITEQGIEGTGVVVTLTATDPLGASVETSFEVSVTQPLPEPYIVNAIEDQLLQAGFESTTVDLTDVFGEDLDGKENLAFVVSSSDETVLTTSVDGTTLTLTEVGFGMTNISVQASNPTLGGTSVTDVFMVRVNANPITTDIPDTDVDIEFGSTQFDLMDFFSDPNGDTITFSITNSNTGAVDVSISEDSVLTITEVAEGSSTLIITASDGFGGSVEDQIIFRVLGPNKAPTLADAFDNLSFFEGFDNETIDLDGAFADEDGDDLTYSVSVSDESVVTAVVGGTFLIIEEVGLGTATFTITADDGRGGTASDAFSVTVEELILGLDLVNGLEVYPNPVKEYLTIFGFQEINTITLFDLVGRKIANFTPDVQGEEAIINMSSLAKGSYLLKIEADGETHLKRVIKE